MGSALRREREAATGKVEGTQKMLISVIRAGKGIFHFTGDLDAYNLELVHELAKRGDQAETAEIRIRIEPGEEDALKERKEWFENFTRAGIAVRVEQAPSKLLRESWYEALKTRSPRSRAPLVPLVAGVKEI